ncbi:hypothetical protein Goshw_002226 [Gossypium schwendimanii]|uniref:Disease resistance N-terminal domain-containing protein n=1 Tax=Gossypium schwendimanii TaxID=34291 RepID=A0A7J9N598_GOSSC|nr:hypothetical protein [Gossypium schwendimanii]
MTSTLVKDWLEKLKDAFYAADDWLDDFSTEALRKDLLSRNKLMKEVCLFFSSSNQFAYGAKMGHQIKARMFYLVEEIKKLHPTPEDADTLEILPAIESVGYNAMDRSQLHFLYRFKNFSEQKAMGATALLTPPRF